MKPAADSPGSRKGKPLIASSELRIVLIYALFASLWILLSDTVVALLFVDPRQIALVSTFKGWLFVAVTSLLLYTLIRRLLAQSLSASRSELAAHKEKANALQLLAAIADHSPDAIFAKNLDGHYMLVNRETARVMGVAVEEALGQRDSALFPHADAEQIMRHDQEVFTSDRPLFLDQEITTVDGPRFFEVTKGPLHDEEGKIIGLFGIARDVSERKCAEDRLIRLSRVYALLSQCNQAIVRCVDESELFEKICHDAVTFGGLSMAWVGIVDPQTQEVVGTASYGEGTDHLKVNPSADESSDLGRGASGSAIRERCPVWVSDYLTDPRTQTRRELGLRYGWRSMAALPLFREGEAVGVLMLYSTDHDTFDSGMREVLVEMAADISFALEAFEREAARQQAEEQLRKLSLAVEQSPECIIIANVDAEIEYVNEAFVQTTGYSREEVIGQNPRLLKSGRTPPASYADLWATLAQGRSWKGEFHNRRKSGEEYVESAHITPLRQTDGSITHYVAIKEDVTERKRNSEELEQHRHRLEDLIEERTAELERARRQAESANLAKSAFLANMSHEIRTPINAIIGLTHLLRRNPSQQVLHERLDKIDGAGQHLLSIINDILDLSKIEANRMQLEHDDFHLSAVLDSVASIIAQSAREKGLRIELDGDGVPLWLRGDVTRLRQALLNFAGNAVKFTEKGFIAIRGALLGEDKEGVLVRFEVEDSGIGIDSEHMPRLFQDFEQGDRGTTRRFGGTGLGLAITKRLANLMGGEVGAESRPEKGSLFWFTARLQRGRGTAPQLIVGPVEACDAEARLRMSFSGSRILLAEDPPVNREVALELLHGVGLDVDTANNGREALEMARAHDYDLILMDMQMPQMDGLEVTRAIRTLSGRADVPILAITANAFDEDRVACEDAGMNDFITKPFDPASLYQNLRLWLDLAKNHRQMDLFAKEGVERAGAARQVVGAALAHDKKEACAGRLALLAKLPGLSLSRGLAALRNKSDKYLDLMEKFVGLHAEDMNRLSTCLAANDFAAAQTIAHGLKGTAGTLGAERLAELAANVEAHMRSPTPGVCLEDLRPQLESIGSELKALATVLRGAVDFEPAPTESAPQEDVRLVLEKLDSLLIANDTEAVVVAEEMSAMLQAALGATWNVVAKHISRFEFEAALQMLRCIDSGNSNRL